MHRRSHNNYKGLENQTSRDEDRAFREITDESSPEISNTEQTSQIVSPDKAKSKREPTYDDDYISSSL